MLTNWSYASLGVTNIPHWKISIGYAPTIAKDEHTIRQALGDLEIELMDR